MRVSFITIVLELVSARFVTINSCTILTLVPLNKLRNFSQPDYLIKVVGIDSHTEWQTVQIQISWLLQKPTDLDLHCLQSRVYPDSAEQGLSEKAVKYATEWERSAQNVDVSNLLQTFI